MHPVFPAPPQTQDIVQRSWSDEHIVVGSHSGHPIRPTSYAPSVSASYSSQPQWNASPPLPPLPPTHPSDFCRPRLSPAAFVEPPPFPPFPHPWRPEPFPHLPSPSYDFTPPLSRQVTDPPPPRPSVDHRKHFIPGSNVLLPLPPLPPPPPSPPPPPVPPRPTVSYENATSTSNFGNSHPSSHAPVQSLINLASPPIPLPAVPLAVPSRPVSSHEVRSERSPKMSLQAAPSPPPLPPKNFMSSATLPLPVPSLKYVTMPQGQNIIVSPSSNALSILDASLTKSPVSDPQVLETIPPDSNHRRTMILSLQESHRKESAVEHPTHEEDGELCQAFAESLAFSAPFERSAVAPCMNLQTDTSRLTIVMHSPLEQESSYTQCSSEASELLSRQRPSFLNLGGVDILSPEELEDHAAHGQIMQQLEDEEVTRQLQEQEEKRLADELRKREMEDEKRARMDAEFTRQLQEAEAKRVEAEKRERELQDEEWARLDEEMARREEAEELERWMLRKTQEREDAEMARRIAGTNDAGRKNPPQEKIREAWGRKEAEMARRIAQTNGHGQAYASQSVPVAHGSAFAPTAPSLPLHNGLMPASGRSTRPMARTAESLPQIYNGSSLPAFPGRTASAFASKPLRPTEHSRSATIKSRAPGQHSDSRLKPESRPSSRDSSPGRTNNARPSISPSRACPSAGPTVAPVDNAAESDLLKGVSYGFKPPDMHSAETLLPCLPFPDVINLSHGPSPPFHIMTTSWKHLMRLLAQLETRIQANIDAIAQSKEEYLLRVVVQVAKLPQSVNTWHTILHITLDLPIPHDVQNSWKSKNKDTTTLPYSYSLGLPTPYLVNDANSQFYVIPLSAASPFPILPISLPNLALYLQSAMRDSRARKVQNDPSNGMRRLAKMVVDCYPEEVVNSDNEGWKPSRGVGRLLRRVVGRGSGQEASQVNEEVYDIITPFRIDQYTIS